MVVKPTAPPTDAAAVWTVTVVASQHPMWPARLRSIVRQGCNILDVTCFDCCCRITFAACWRFCTVGEVGIGAYCSSISTSWSGTHVNR